MTEQEFEYWRSITDISTSQWVEDSVTKLNGKGYLYYIGGDDGYFMRISPDGKFTIGTYEGAYPHIGEALFTPKAEHKYENVDGAFMAALKIGGRQFLIDKFKNNAPQYYKQEISDEENESISEIDDGLSDSGIQLL